MLNGQVDSDLKARVIEQAKLWYGDQVNNWEHLRTYHIKHALPVQSCDYLQTVEKAESSENSIHFCGDYKNFASINGAMVSGRQLAESLGSDGNHISRTTIVDLDSYSDVATRMKALVLKGASRDDVANQLKQDEYSIMKSIRVFQLVYDLRLGDAKSAVLNSSCWKAEKEQHAEFVDQLLDDLGSYDESD